MGRQAPVHLARHSRSTLSKGPCLRMPAPGHITGLCAGCSAKLHGLREGGGGNTVPPAGDGGTAQGRWLLATHLSCRWPWLPLPPPLPPCAAAPRLVPRHSRWRGPPPHPREAPGLARVSRHGLGCPPACSCHCWSGHGWPRCCPLAVSAGNTPAQWGTIGQGPVEQRALPQLQSPSAKFEFSKRMESQPRSVQKQFSTDFHLSNSLPLINPILRYLKGTPAVLGALHLQPYRLTWMTGQPPK
jgi:hypothetical protein